MQNSVLTNKIRLEFRNFTVRYKSNYYLVGKSLWERDLKKFVEDELNFIYMWKSRFFEATSEINITQSIFSTGNN